MSDYGIKMSKPGVDVKTASDKDLSWSSDFKTFKVYKTVKITSVGTTAHGLNYAPAFIAFRQEDTPVTGAWVCMQRGYQLGGRGAIQVDDTNIHCYDDTDDLYVILFIDPLDE